MIDLLYARFNRLSRNASDLRRAEYTHSGFGNVRHVFVGQPKQRLIASVLVGVNKFVILFAVRLSCLASRISRRSLKRSSYARLCFSVRTYSACLALHDSQSCFLRVRSRCVCDFGRSWSSLILETFSAVVYLTSVRYVLST